MADRPQISGWRGGTAGNWDTNKPQLYSSEWEYGGRRYANVTDVSTGQRQLYGVLTGVGTRTLISSTNADGTITKGPGYDTIIGAGGSKLYQTLDSKNKAQSVALLSNPNLFAPQEAQKIADSKEFKSTAAGANAAKTGQVTSEQISATAGKEVGGTRSEFPGVKGSDPLRYPINLKSDYQDVIKFKMVKYTPKKFSQTTFGFGSRNLAGSNDRQIIGTVILPIPAGISDTNAVSWAGQDMNALEAAGANLALSGIEGGGDKMAATAENIAKTVSGASADVQKSLAAAIAGQAVGVQGILARTTGLINNPNMELLFQAPTLRPFTFNFKLSARNSKEARTIRSIIRFFKQGMSPIRTQSQLFLKAPHTFQLEYLHKNDTHSYLNKFKECALQSFSVNYTPENQYATFTDGAMVSYQITMQFQELEPVFNDDYGNASNAPDTEIGY